MHRCQTDGSAFCRGTPPSSRDCSRASWHSEPLTGERVVATLGGVLSTDSDLVSILTGGARVDANLRELEADIGERAEQAQAIEQEAEKHFGRVYRSLADTLNRRRSRV